MKFDSKQKKYFLLMFALIFVCELLLKIDNHIIQFLGIILILPITVLGFLFLKRDGIEQNS